MTSKNIQDTKFMKKFNMKKDEKKLDHLVKNFETFRTLITKVSAGVVKKGLEALVEEQGERIAVCPASMSSNYIGSFPGGYVWYSLEVLKTMKELNKLYSANLSVDSLIVASLFHDIGKIGDETEDYYLPQESNWHKERGMNYTTNEKLQHSSVMSRSLWWLTSNFPMKEEEITAIHSLANLEKRSYGELYNCSMLSLVLQQAVQSVCVRFKGVKSPDGSM